MGLNEVERDMALRMFRGGLKLSEITDLLVPSGRRTAKARDIERLFFNPEFWIEEAKHLRFHRFHGIEQYRAPRFSNRLIPFLRDYVEFTQGEDKKSAEQWFGSLWDRGGLTASMLGILSLDLMASVQRHYGYYPSGEYWLLQEFRQANKQLRRKWTMTYGGVLAFKVPDNLTVEGPKRWGGDPKVILESGKIYTGILDRCPLSESWHGPGYLNADIPSEMNIPFSEVYIESEGHLYHPSASIPIEWLCREYRDGEYWEFPYSWEGILNGSQTLQKHSAVTDKAYEVMKHIEQAKLESMISVVYSNTET
jgi:hypothetical protein